MGISAAVDGANGWKGRSHKADVMLIFLRSVFCASSALVRQVMCKYHTRQLSCSAIVNDALVGHKHTKKDQIAAAQKQQHTAEIRYKWSCQASNPSWSNNLVCLNADQCSDAVERACVLHSLVFN